MVDFWFGEIIQTTVEIYPWRCVIQRPVPGGDKTAFEFYFQAIGFEPVIGQNIEAAFFAGVNLTPAVVAAATRTV